MTVAELIKKLKKMPKDAKVFNKDHDHGDYETNGSTRVVDLVRKEDAYEENDLQDQDYLDHALMEDMPDVWVVLGV